MTPLNLPRTELKLSRKEGRIYVWCPIRKKKLLLTPEEWVRQHFIAYLFTYLNISAGRIISEFSLVYNSMSRRADIIVVDDFGKPFIIVECKAPQIALSENTFFQIAQYQNSIPAQYLILTNGLEHMCMNLSTHKNEITTDIHDLKKWLAIA